MCKAGSRQPVDGETDVRLRGFSEGVGDEIGEGGAGGDVRVRVGQVPRRHGQRLIDAVTAGREHDLGDRLLERVDLPGDGPVAGNGVVNRVEPVGLDCQLAAIQRNHQFAQVLSIFPGLDHGRAVVDDDRVSQLGVAVAADDHVDPRHGLGQAHVVAVAEAPVLAFLHAAVTESDHHIHLLRLAENRAPQGASAGLFFSAPWSGFRERLRFDVMRTSRLCAVRIARQRV